jgi:hypothetical protein
MQFSGRVAISSDFPCECARGFNGLENNHLATLFFFSINEFKALH